MNTLEFFLNVIIIFTFCLQISNYVIMGRGRIPYVGQCVVLCGFIFVEAYWAVHGTPAMWAYVSLNIWGIMNLLRGYIKRRY